MSSYELRTYVAMAGRMDDLLRRFRDHTVRLFREHKMESLGYWISEEDPDVLVYMLKHHGDAEKNWVQFRNDPRWISALEESQKDGSLTMNIESRRLHAADVDIEPR